MIVSTIAVVKNYWFSLCGTGVTWIAALTARYEAVEWWLRQAASLSALFVSILTAIHILKNWNKKK